MSNKQWSIQQQAFLDWAVNGKGSCILSAVAGAGKTTTILEAAKQMPGQCALVAYNKKIAEEIKDRLVKMGVDWKKAQAGTVHSFGFNAYRKAFPNVKVDDHKVVNLIDDNCDEAMRAYSQTIAKLVSLAKQRALGVAPNRNLQNIDQWIDIWDHFDLLSNVDDDREVPQDAIIRTAIEILQKSNRQTSVIDFDDMIYLPLVHSVRMWQFDNVFVDEAQDTNPARRALVRVMVKKGGRVIAVGDQKQTIYGFTGTDNDSLDQIRADFNAQTLPLSVSFRCAKEVIKFAQQWNTEIQHHEKAAEGSVSSINLNQIFARNDLNETSAILCRNTKPLVELAFSMIRKRIACKVEGRDIAENLKKLVTRWKIKTINALEEKLDQYMDRERTKLLARKQEAKMQVIEDTVETIKVIIDQCRTENKTQIQDVVDYIDGLFADNVQGILTLSTGHKAKGREWENVFWLDRAGTCPSKWARQQWQKDQEINLCYVIATRAKINLIEVIK